MRQPSRLELNYREVAHNVYRMVAEGTFPYTEHSELFDPAARVGDGLIRLDVSGAIIYASPNAKSAFNRIGWAGELDGNVLGEIARKVSQVKPEAHEEAMEVSLSGKSLRRVEIENTGGTIDLLVLPLLPAEIALGRSFCCRTLLNFAVAKGS
jgi:two-component system, sensor histidine kinase PdtaS